jgi:hypothetical protein
VVPDVVSLALMLNWHVVHRQNKRLMPVAQAFKDFLLNAAGDLFPQTVVQLPAQRSKK